MREIRVKEALLFCLVAMVTVFLGGCKRDLPEPCPSFPKEDGYTYVKGEGAGFKLRLPSWVGIVPTGDCSHVRSANMSFLWYQGKIRPMDGSFERSVSSADYRRIWVGLGGFSNKTDLLQKEKEVSVWRYEGGIPHEKYPLEIYPRSSQSPRQSDDVMWGVRNTTDPITGRPVRASCDIAPASKDWRSAAQGEFSKHGDSKCAAYLRVAKGEKIVMATVYIWVESIDHIDQIVNSIQYELVGMIVER